MVDGGQDGTCNSVGSERHLKHLWEEIVIEPEPLERMNILLFY